MSTRVTIPENATDRATEGASWRNRRALVLSVVGGMILAILAASATSCVGQGDASSGSAASPETASPEAIENLRAFAKLYGYVRYFHPSDGASAIDWERFAIHGVQEVLDAASRAELKQRLEAISSPIAPTVQIYAAEEGPPAPASVLTPDDAAGLDPVAWQHRGVGLGNPGPYRSTRLHRETREPVAGPPFGPVGQTIEAAGHRGREVRLDAYVKADVSGTGNQAQLWLRVDRAGGQTGFLRQYAGPSHHGFRVGVVSDHGRGGRRRGAYRRRRIPGGERPRLVR